MAASVYENEGLFSTIVAYGQFKPPDPITFILGEEYLNRPNLYPRQATLIKIIFLRDDLFTDYDLAVIEEWEENFRRTGNNGICPNILWRIKWLKAQGHPWFREVLLVLGRRAGKGYVTALCLAYVLWTYMGFGDPQGEFGVDRDKKLTLMCFAAKREQAKENVWSDLNNVILGSNCFAPYVGKPLGESLSVKAPNDSVRAKELLRKGIVTAADMSSFSIVPKESTLTAGRGPASFAQVYDEMAHVVNAGANRSAEEVYCLDPMTRVLGADLLWRSIKDLVIGDEVIAFDEHVKPGEGQRKMRRAVVEGIKWSRSRPVKITFEDGTSVVCSDNHRWFSVSDDCNGGRWKFAGRPPRRQGSSGRLAASLKPGDNIRFIAEPWETDDSRDGGYLAGILDGEGWVGAPTTTAFRVGISQNPGLVLDETESLLKQFGFDYSDHAPHESVKSKTHELVIGDIAQCLRLLGQFRPVRLLAKSAGLWENKTPRGRQKYKKIASIERMPEQDLVDIQTSEATFIAEGLVSHNTAATPSLDQFGKYAIIFEPSSPWQMLGQFYDNYLHSIEVEEDDPTNPDVEAGTPVYPEMLMLQLTSWDIYVDWEMAHEIPLFPDDFRGDKFEYFAPEDDDPDAIHQKRPYPSLKKMRAAIQAYDDQMRRLERSNPDTFKVERRSHFAAALDAYLNADLVAKIFQPWAERPERYGPPSIEPQTGGLLAISYKGHGDPSKVNDKFGVAVAHVEYDAENRAHCVFDLLHHFDPADFDGGIIDYEYVDNWIWKNVITKFYPEEFTFDQYNSTSSIQRLQKMVRNNHLPKRVNIFEKTTTGAYDWTVKENSKAAINLGLVHAPPVTVDDSYERAELELRFLQSPRPGKVDHPSAGPVQSKDIADAMTECIHVLIGEQVNNFVHADMAMTPQGIAQEGFTPFEGAMDRAELDVMRSMSGFGRARGMRDIPRNRTRGRQSRW